VQLSDLTLPLLLLLPPLLLLLLLQDSKAASDEAAGEGVTDEDTKDGEHSSISISSGSRSAHA
jgi:hypothetical protein